MILVDTGPIVAVINDRDDHHQECKYLLERLPGPLLIPATVATEVCLMLERRRGTYAELAFLSDVRAGRCTSLCRPLSRHTVSPAGTGSRQSTSAWKTSSISTRRPTLSAVCRAWA